MPADVADAPSRAKWPALRNSVVVGVFAALLGVGLIGIGVPLTVAAWEGAKSAPAMDKYQAGQIPSEQEVRDGVAGLREAVKWNSTSRRLSDLAVLELQLAQFRASVSVESGPLRAAAEQHLRASVAANPGDGLAWFRLAFVYQLQNKPGREIAVSLVHSLDMAPSMRGIWISRARSLLAYRRFLTDDEILALRNHLKVIWLTDAAFRMPLLLAAQGADQLPALATALDGDTEARAEFDKLKAQLPVRQPN